MHRRETQRNKFTWLILGFVYVLITEHATKRNAKEQVYLVNFRFSLCVDSRACIEEKRKGTGLLG